MQKTSHDASPAVLSLGLALACFGCAPGTSSDTASSSLGGSGAIAGAGGHSGPGISAGVAGYNAAFAGSSASGAAGRSGSNSSGLIGAAGIAGAASFAGVGGSFAGMGASGRAGMRGTAGMNASGRGDMGGTGGSRASSGGAGAQPSAGSGGNATASGPIWMPKPGTTWQWQLTKTLDTSVDAQMYDIDLFDNSEATIQMLHAAGRTVVCYFSAGSYEPERPDSDALSKTGLGSALDGWPDEKWLDVRAMAVRDLMKARLDLAKSKGCDGVEPDNVDGFDNKNGLGLTEQDALDYDKFLANEGHARGLSVGLKNSLGLVSNLVSYFDWALNEECLQYDECDSLEPFISAGKAVFHCEYAKDTNGICGKAPQGFSTIVKNLDLDAFRLACN